MFQTGKSIGRVQFAFIMLLMAVILAVALTLYSIHGASSIPLWDIGQPSLITVVLHTTILVSLIVTAVSFRRFNPIYIKPNSHLASLYRWLNRIAVILGIAFVLTLLVILILFLVFRSSSESTVSPALALLITTVYAAALGFFLAYWTSGLTYQQLIWFTGVSIILGVIGAVVLAPDSSWWTGVVSFLGLGPSGWVFDFTFILGGLLLLIVLDDKLDDLDILRAAGKFQSPRFTIYRIILTLQCIAIVGIGLFPYTGVTLWPHRILSIFAAMSFLIFAPAFIWVTPIYSAWMRWFSIVPIIVFGLTIIGYFGFNLAFSLMELVVVAVVMLWLLMFYYTTRAYILKVQPDLETD